MYRSLTTALVLVVGASASSTKHLIDVGKLGALSFSPNTTTAAVGDTLEFHFYSGSGGHSVVSSTFESPCEPAPGAFFSGYQMADAAGDVTFVVNVTSTDPIWFYCSLASHCQEGMVGVVNPQSGQTISDYMNAAANVSQASAPASLTGGTLTSINEATETVTSNPGGPSQTATTTSSGASVRSGVQATPTVSTSTGPMVTTTTKNDARPTGDMSFMLGLGAVAGGLALLMG